MISYPARAYRRFLAALQRDVLGPPPFMGLSSAGNPNILPVAPATTFPPAVVDGLQIGDELVGPNLAPGTFVVNIESNLQIVTNQNGLFALPGLVTDQSRGSPTIHLYKDTAGPGPDPTPASFTEADFTGYAPIPLSSFVGPFTDPQNIAELVANAAWVLSADPAVGNDIKGWWIEVAPGSPEVIAWEGLNPMRPMRHAGDAVVLTVPLSLPTPLSSVE